MTSSVIPFTFHKDKSIVLWASPKASSSVRRYAYVCLSEKISALSFAFSGLYSKRLCVPKQDLLRTPHYRAFRHIEPSRNISSSYNSKMYINLRLIPTLSDVKLKYIAIIAFYVYLVFRGVPGEVLGCL